MIYTKEENGVEVVVDPCNLQYCSVNTFVYSETFEITRTFSLSHLELIDFESFVLL